jgi:hypothetical protein
MMGRSLPAGQCGQRWLVEQGAGRALGGLVAVLQLTGATVPVRKQTDPAAIKMSEATSSGSGGSEVGVDVMQIQAPLGIGSDVHRAPPLHDISLALCQRPFIVSDERAAIQGQGRPHSARTACRPSATS